MSANNEPTSAEAQGAGGTHMVDISEKPITRRTAVASGRVVVSPATLEMIATGSIPKGDVLATARVAGIMAAKRTPDLVPLCHPIPLDSVSVELQLDRERRSVNIRATVVCTARTGAEMEALTAVTVAALTVYDMCKQVDPAMQITDVYLLEKSGGKSGYWVRAADT